MHVYLFSIEIFRLFAILFEVEKNIFLSRGERER